MAEPAATPRSLTQMLREWDDRALARLLVERPDLADPPPERIEDLASRATTRQSVLLATQWLSSLDLWVARRALAADPPFSATDLAAPGIAADDVAASVRRLLELALAWGSEGHLRLVRALRPALGDHPAGEAPPLAAPNLSAGPRQSPDRVDRVAAGSAFAVLRHLEVLVEHAGRAPLRLGPGDAPTNREVRATAAVLDVPVGQAAALVSLAAAAGLLGAVQSRAGPALAPGAGYDEWRARPLADQWWLLVDTWLHRHPVSGSARLKRLLMGTFGDPADGRVIDWTDLREWLRWRLPLRPHAVDAQARAMLEEAAWLGISGLGALASYAPWRGDPAGLAGLLPDRVDHVVVQADLTAVAPGPLTLEAARELGALAEVESRGGATVFRFTVEALERAHDLGWEPARMAATLQRRSATPLPQPLRYLIDDLARRTPVRVAPPGSVPPGSVPPVPPGPFPPVEFVETRERPRDGKLEAAAARRLVAALRSTTGDDGVAVPAGPASIGLGKPLVTLREAVETGEVVWFGYVDSAGGSGERLVRALSVDDGRLRAVDARSGAVLSVPVHRITAAHILRA
ncbi:MAG TPA: helicase-associated domain-containing protein [Nocardioidaceae bacterium]|nr:helicase-associated domain-containing protein [Nocardioidaceae bacterium]